MSAYYYAYSKLCPMLYLLASDEESTTKEDFCPTWNLADKGETMPLGMSPSSPGGVWVSIFKGTEAELLS